MALVIGTVSDRSGMPGASWMIVLAAPIAKPIATPPSKHRHMMSQNMLSARRHVGSNSCILLLLQAGRSPHGPPVALKGNPRLYPQTLAERLHLDKR
jgi:hypothetical protein